nr:RNA helicase Mov10l1-like [Nerophis lumbriciformis]
MFSAVRGILSKLVSPLWSTAQVDADGGSRSPDSETIRQLCDGVVTQLSLDYGLIDDAIYFTSGVVLGGVPLKVGDMVNCIAVGDGAQGGWKALRVMKSCDAWEGRGGISVEDECAQLRPLIGRVTSYDGKGGQINNTTYFSCSSLWEGYEPMKGDWVQATYLIDPNQWTTQAQSVAPLRFCRLNQVRVTSIYEKEGVVGDSVFFCLDSLMLPAHYRPLPGHVVNLVMLESSQSRYHWRALCMAPCTEGNKGSKTHHLKFCNFAGWDSEEQFFLKTLERELKEPASDSCPVPVEERGSHAGATGGKETQHSLGVRREERGADIPPGERLCVVVGCQAKSLGSCAELLLLHFSSFDIGRRLEVTVCCNDERLLLPHVPYSQVDTKPVRVAPSHVITITAPQDTLRLPNRHLPSFLPSYTVPQALRDCVAGQKDILVIQPCLGEVLSASNAQARFSTLLWMEEIHAENELGGFTIQGVLLRKGVVYLHLEILGLAEGRPYLTIGDRILLKSPQSDGGVMEYVSYVVEINDEDVSLRVNSDFHHSYLGEPLDVEFCYNRTTMKRCHHAVEQIKSFVENSNVPLKPTPRLGHFFNRDLNPAQKEAVKRILAGECRPTPYVLFGPPGTGKTITLIEVILQVYHFVPSARILVCTPSNSAADLICLRLHNSGLMHTASMARVNASYRQDKNIPDVLRPYSKAGEDLSFASFHRIVVSTCSSAGLFYNLGLRVGHFTHVFLDEAGQATEPESMIPISLISEIDGQIVLAGDPCQLGPIVKSKIASTFGLGLSLMERLMANPLYARHQWGYNPKLVTKLIYNYRSHEALLSLPSKLFYHGELCVRAPKDVVDSLCQWKTLPKKGFPLLFHGIRGKEMREGNNPSWFNPAEAVQVMLYCCQLTKKLYNPVDASQIGIISPYRKQSEKIRILLGKVGLSDIKVGSVEEFQGQEFLVIILSTVRSNELASSDDLQSALGFLANPKRFNVAITRSRALLLIIGNPHLLIRDTCFRALLNYCFTNGGYLGCDPPPAIRDSQM